MKVLDHGSVDLVEAWGSDERIIEAARMSTGGGFRGWGTVKEPGDERLLRYLWQNRHATPFEMAGLVVEVQAPIFVIREWHRHRTQSYSEASARYGPLPDLHYLPTVERVMGEHDGTNKQAGPATWAKPLTREAAESFIARLSRSQDAAEALYRDALDSGIPKELARLAMPVSRYTRMRASANLRNWLSFLALRLDGAAQHEIREYARAIEGIVAERFPRTWRLFSGVTL
jgi:thymidylate synthase (FAD)